ncbi:MAG: alpha/beta fold hydrolase [FCB group bacterium]|nr:alpha/beta fold hydrolase [FCB group bacterium]
MLTVKKCPRGELRLQGTLIRQDFGNSTRGTYGKSGDELSSLSFSIKSRKELSSPVNFLELILLLLQPVVLVIFSRKQSSRWNGLLILLLAILLTLIHFLTEGYRWQMVPAYLLLTGLYLWHRLHPHIRMGLPARIGFSVWWLIALLTPLLLPRLTLPDPGGSYPVGTQTVVLTDSSREEWFTENPDDFRRIVVQIWYPAQSVTGLTPEPYLDHMDVRGPAMIEQLELPEFLKPPSVLVRFFAWFRTHSFPGALPVSDPSPVVVVSPGLGGSRLLHRTLAEYLASRGMAVAILDHPYDANLTIFPDGQMADYRSELKGMAPDDSTRLRHRQLRTRVDDLHFLLAQLKQNSALFPDILQTYPVNSFFLVGHSFGGTTVFQTALERKDIQAVIALDGWNLALPDSSLDQGLSVPVLYLGRPHWNNPNNYRRLARFLMADTTTYSRWLILHSVHHFDFTDVPLLSPLLKLMGQQGTIPPERVVPMVNSLVAAFIAGNSLDYPEAVAVNPETVLKEEVYDFR